MRGGANKFIKFVGGPYKWTYQMDRGKLEFELAKLCQVCQERGIPIQIEGLSEAYPGVANTSYTIHIKAQGWSKGISCLDILNQILPILFESTSLEARQSIFSLDVYNVEEGMNCHHVDTFTPFELAC